MSGPEYPRGPLPGSNAIGSFAIGVSPMGDIPPFDYWQTVISQYANSPIITQLVSNFFQYVDQTRDFNELFDWIWNIDSAQGFGLDIWGRILGVGRILDIPNLGRYLGFEEASPTIDPFNQSPFYVGDPLTTSFALSDSAYRTLLFAKALANISDGTIQSMNQLLINLFPNRGNAFVTDDGLMTMTYTFNFALTPVEAAIITQSGVLPKPTGVLVSYVQNY